MIPERKMEVNGHLIEEFYWHGDMVVYIDNHKTEMSYEEAIERMKDNDT